MDARQEQTALLARLTDLAGRAERGELACSAFLSPRDVMVATQYLSRSGISHVAFGGYADAERQRVLILPDYMESLSSLSCEELPAAVAEYGYSCGVAALSVRGSGYEALSHRSFLGSLLGLGLERDVVGDIAVLDEREAVLFCDEAIVPFLLAEWQSVGRDKVTVRRVDLSQLTLPERRYETIRDTVASPRLDAVVASVCRLSRERARDLVENGMVEVDFEWQERADKPIGAPCLLSVRGFGRYRILSVGERTKKGRYRLEAQKFL